MGTVFDDSALEDLMYWMKHDRKNAEKIHALIKDIRRNGLDKGIGHPEPLRYQKAWSRRIDQCNRLVYNADKDGNLQIIACKGHYEE